jgi:hypothetical protein
VVGGAGPAAWAPAASNSSSRTGILLLFVVIA